MANTSTTLPWQRAIIALSATTITVVVIGALYWAQLVFVPLALAIFITFLLNPLVRGLQRRGLPRFPSVVVAVLLAAFLLGGLGWLVARQVTGLIAELPNYTANINDRIKSVRELTGDGGRLEKMIAEVSDGLKSEPTHSKGESTRQPPEGANEKPSERPPAFVVQAESFAWLGRLPTYLSSVMEVVGCLGLTLILVVFMLQRREDLRNRFLWFVGHGRLSFTTKAVDEAGQRISRYLLMQFLVNSAFGLVLAVALLLIGVDNALLWGLAVTVMRYVPYIGAWIAAALLFILSLAMFSGWVQPLMILGVMVTLELLTGNVVEPLVYGQSLGVSEVALLVAAAFWAFLWGPIGLVLSGPLTVCLVVLGRYVSQLHFLEALLGDEPVLSPNVRYYQRLLARDQDEATALVLAQAKNLEPDQVCDELLVPTLTYLKRDRESEELTEADEEFVLQAVREAVSELGHQLLCASPVAQNEVGPKVRVLACPGDDEADVLALEMLRQLLDPARWEFEILSMDLLSAELVAQVGDKAPEVVCIGALPPGGLTRTRHLCRRLRSRLPEAKIVVGRWGLNDNVEANQEQLREAGADQVATTLRQTRTHLVSWLPVLSQQEKRDPADLNISQPLAATCS